MPKVIKVPKVTVAKLRKYSITTGAALDDNYMAVILTEDARTRRDPDDPHSFLGVRRDEAWYLLGPLPFTMRSQVTVDKPSPCLLTVSSVGMVRRSTQLGSEQEDNVGKASGLRVLGRTRLLEARSIDGHAYVVGTRRAAYRRDGAGAWKCIDKGCYSKDMAGFLSFESIHGFSRSEIYAVGQKGDLWEYDGKKWKQHHVGTAQTLHKVLCAPDGTVYAVGRGGTIVRGRHSKWSILKGVPEGYDFWGLEHFAGKLYLTAGTTALLHLAGRQVKPVNFKDCPIPETAHHLTASKGSLYCFGAKDIRRFDGRKWHDELTL